ncbi:recombinase family protein [Hymenobacter cellulosivorans]|uniref:Recombinase family protein n=1 Tax=Hymenobacter cellulosivorans TaxID=2932249 RepID=A0ABY4FGU9_9BACT|nr:recombinase family protein [Hymenobacter cellulosivorans]UOQ55640.1 recombinase family protein [Hymenobacter cellulosivorans]
MHKNFALQQFGKPSKQAGRSTTNRVVIYTRVSTKEQADTNHSLELQKKQCWEHAKANNYEVVEYFGGTYESAKDDGRKEFSRMLKFVEQQSNRISRIIVFSYDRFSRTGGRAIALIAKLRSEGIIVDAVTQQVDASTPEGQLFQSIQLLFSNFDNSLRARRALAGTKERIRNGYWTARAPIGYTMSKQGNEQIIVINKTGELLQQAFRMKLEDGFSNTQLIAWLRKRGVKLSKSLLGQTFRNPFYCGYIRHSSLDGAVIQGRHPALITPDQFLQLHNLQKQPDTGYVHAKEVSPLPLKHHVRCHRCGRPLTGYEVKAKALWYYKCNTIGCKLNIGARQLHAAYQDLLRGYKLLPHLIKPLKAWMATVFTQLNQEGASEKNAVETSLKQVQAKLEKMEARYALGDLDQTTYQKYSRKIIAEELEPLQATLESLGSSLSNLEAYIDFAVNLATNILTMWEKSNLITRQKLQHMLHPNGIAFAPEIGFNRTDRQNTVFAVIASLSDINKNEKTGPNTIKSVKSGLVGPTGIEPVTC